ncbi:hypothetical protein [Cupriavidus pauculus]|uniref:hypothetical protein n=1 Tax=Cupriavidus pauculus TaxID=82633 RepID=UPI001EE18FD1|nr:hypothetical protein [Cupriavidus pauculus]GJG96930.1 hypothetical protein CBA19C6_20595 [Cupriavidus pauculus]
MHAHDNAAPARLVEVWGDTADTRHLAWSIVIGAAISLTGYLIASRLLAAVVQSAELARAYAMLAGLFGCLVAGVVCAVLFKPKRVVVENETGHSAAREEALRKLAEDAGGLGSIADLPPAVVAELRELQLLDLFQAHEQRDAVRASEPSPVLPQRQTV